MEKLSNGLGFIVEPEGIYKVEPLSYSHPEQHVYDLVMDRETFVKAFQMYIAQENKGGNDDKIVSKKRDT